MKKTITLLIILLLVLFMVGCENSVNPTEPISSGGSLLFKKPIQPPEIPPTPMPALNLDTEYIAGIGEGKVFIWDIDNLTNIWSTSIEAFTINGIGIGNFIGDANKQLLVERRIKRGKNKKDIIESQELLIFTEDNIEPFKTVVLRQHEDYEDALWDMKIANVDDDSDLEIILAFRDKLEIWESDGTEISPTATFDYFSLGEIPWGIDVGDFNSDGINEIIVCFSGNIWRSYEYNGSSSSISQIEESIAYNEIGSLNCVKIADIDYDEDVEVIGGSSIGKILVWESPNQIIASDQVIPIYYAWAVDVGEIDGEVGNGKEIIGVSSNSGGLHLFHYNDGDLDYEGELFSALSNSLNDVIVSGVYPYNKIIVATSNGLEVYDNTYENPFIDNVGSLQNLIFE